MMKREFAGDKPLEPPWSNVDYMIMNDKRPMRVIRINYSEFEVPWQRFFNLEDADEADMVRIDITTWLVAEYKEAAFLPSYFIWKSTGVHL
jgi:hypothetical protein